MGYFPQNDISVIVHSTPEVILGFPLVVCVCLQISTRTHKSNENMTIQSSNLRQYGNKLENYKICKPTVFKAV